MPSRTRTTRSVRRAAMASVLAGLAFASTAHAGTTGTVSLTSDYIFRGTTQTNQEPALQGGVEYAAESGLYIGTWGSNVSWLSDLSTPAAPISSSLELDVYGGYRGKFNDTVSYDVGALYYWYPGDFPSGFNSADTLEVYGGITVAASEKVTLGAKVSVATTDLFGYTDSTGSAYLDLSANFVVAEGWTIGAHAGKQWIDGNAAFEYADWKLGVTKAFASGFSVGLAYTGTDADDALYTNPLGNKVARDTVALTVTKAF
ncbi:MAG TPA: TorF family putative porin [Thermomonas sp.]|nr:TorF family putative porin [Thermomonas sp.]